MERGLEFLLSTDLFGRSFVATSDAPGAIAPILHPRSSGGRNPVEERLAELIGQFDALRFRRGQFRENAEAGALACLGLTQLDLHRAAFEVCDDSGWTDWAPGRSAAIMSEDVPETADHPSHPFFSLPLDAEEQRELLERVPFRDREILRLRYGGERGRVPTMAEIGRVFRISGGRVGQVLKRRLRQLWGLAARSAPLGWRPRPGL